MEAKATTDKKTPHVFISYCWSSPEHEAWVINLAERLISNGVDVTIDKWNLKEGQDKHSFMESMVKSDSIDKILVILDEKYCEKADSRSGGVGTETQIISPKVYGNVAQEKFIPVIAETDSEGKPFVPTYLGGRIYIDLSSTDQYEKNFEQLLRNLFKRPAYSKPALGTPPEYLFEDTVKSHRTSSHIRSLEHIIERSPNRINGILREFLDDFFKELSSYTISFTNDNKTLQIGKEIFDNINSYTPLRDNFIKFFDKLLKSNTSFDIDIIIKFLEKLPGLIYPQSGANSWFSFEFDNYRFIIKELFLYLVTIGLKNENFVFISGLLHTKYFIHDRYRTIAEPKTYEEFYYYIDSINTYYNEAFSQTFNSPMADLIITRIPKEIDSEDLVEADMLCYYIGKFLSIDWFPITYIYKKSERFDLFLKLCFKRHFEKIKVLFNLESPITLKEALNNIKNKDNSPDIYYGGRRPITPIYRAIDIEKIAIY